MGQAVCVYSTCACVTGEKLAAKLHEQAVCVLIKLIWSKCIKIKRKREGEERRIWEAHKRKINKERQQVKTQDIKVASLVSEVDVGYGFKNSVQCCL